MIPVELRWNRAGGVPDVLRMPIESQMLSILNSWEDTPYIEGQCVRGSHGGVDCVRFATAVWYELRGLPIPENLARLPTDASLHAPEKSWAVVRELVKLHEPVDEFIVPVTDRGGRKFYSVQPGDIIGVGVGSNPAPAHSLIIGPRMNEMWHCIGRRVKRTGISLPYRGGASGFQVVGVWRMADLYI